MKMKAIAIMSGGLDSTTVLAMCHHRAKKDLPEVIAGVFFLYGQHHRREIGSAQEVAIHYNTPLRIVRLPDIRGSALTDGQVPLDRPMAEYTTKGVRAPTYVPFRNTIFIAHAAAVAEELGADGVIGGWHGADVGYPDCQEKYLLHMQKALRLGSDSKMFIWRPLVRMTKKDIVKVAIRYNAPIELTWSCYLRHEAHCGRCGTCQQRIEAFKACGVVDPVPYLKPIDWGTARRLNEDEHSAREDDRPAQRAWRR